MDDLKLICSNLSQKMKLLKKHINEQSLMFSFQSAVNFNKKNFCELSIFCSSKNNIQKDTKYFKDLIIDTDDIYFNFKELEITLSQLFLNKTCHIMIQLFDNEQHNFYRGIAYDPIKGLIGDVSVAQENIPLNYIKGFLQKEEGVLYLAKSNHDLLLKDGAIFKCDFPNNYPYASLISEDNLLFKKNGNTLHIFLRIETVKIDSFEPDYFTIDLVESFNILQI